MIRFLTVVPLCLGLGACMATAPVEQPSRAATEAVPMLPPMKTFRSQSALPPSVSNRDLARDILDLAFELESGSSLSTFTRVEGPITVRLTGPAPISLSMELENLLGRLRREAGLNISLVQSGAATITIEAVQHAQIRRFLPSAACFVAPNVSSLTEYAGARRSPRTDWTRLQNRQKLAIFLPVDTPPQEMRDCLHEELAQALGPLNDLYRLSDSVFNDDNVHTVLTGYDMLVLRAFYAPELRTGMSRAEVARRLPDILARLNPAGINQSALRRSDTPRAWIDAIQTALGPGASKGARLANAQKAVNIARTAGWEDHRRAFAHYALGRVVQSRDPDVALSHFLAAQRYYAQTPGAELHRAQVAQQLAAYALLEGRAQAALDLIGPHLNVARRHENAALLSTLMLLRAEALDLKGLTAEARLVRLDSLGWARYGFGSDAAVRAKAQEIATLNPLKRGNGRL
ncbi:DUF2927 domain-containing protein [Thalassovita mediterranea]|uniref:ATP-dependent transcriptional regulator n=2 Tax=Thalassovita mediterranea TaxID=340021 RepID=A0A0P1GN32_9RHOB|nr:DUF2927 domain-containing protein [Thalassovita mediterranea]CUH83630.1 hypothetical protein TM5383_00826 [Thalassovita mediterranea]SIS28818.1 Protein of unknown function [Thalassovita mediterranea]